MEAINFVGIDPGNSSCKIVAEMCDGTQLEKIIPNVTARAEELEAPPTTNDPFACIDVEILNASPEYAGGRFVGALAGQVDYEQDRGRILSESEKINLIVPACLAVLAQNNDKFVVGTGAPFADFIAERPELLKYLQRDFAVKFGIYSGGRAGKAYNFSVPLVALLPQTAAGFAAELEGELGTLHPEWAQQNVIVFDFGLGQTGAGYFCSKEPQKSACFSADDPVAFIDIARAVRDFLNTEYRREIKIPKAVQVVEDGEYVIENNPIEGIRNVIEIACQTLARRLYVRYRENVPVEYRDEANAIICIGGGAKATGLIDALIEVFNLPGFVGKKPRFANAQGYLLHAKKRYEKELIPGGKFSR